MRTTIDKVSKPVSMRLDGLGNRYTPAKLAYIAKMTVKYGPDALDHIGVIYVNKGTNFQRQVNSGKLILQILIFTVCTGCQNAIWMRRAASR